MGKPINLVGNFEGKANGLGASGPILFMRFSNWDDGDFPTLRYNLALA